MSDPMIDVQSLTDYRNINVDKVGVKDIRYPITVMDKNCGVQNTVASINMYVNLPREFKGTHMSRFIEILNEFHGRLDIREFSMVLEAMKDRPTSRSPFRIS
jgi:GTP cyclohydrolase I